MNNCFNCKFEPIWEVVQTSKFLWFKEKMTMLGFCHEVGSDIVFTSTENKILIEPQCPLKEFFKEKQMNACYKYIEISYFCQHEKEKECEFFKKAKHKDMCKYRYDIDYNHDWRCRCSDAIEKAAEEYVPEEE